MGGYGTCCDVGYTEYQVELYLPSYGLSCSLPHLPDPRTFNSLDPPGLVCGGQWGTTEDTCLKWSPDIGTWMNYLTLDYGKMSHVSWTPSSGIGTYLIGGEGGILNTTLITPKATQEPGFTLEYRFMYV